MFPQSCACVFFSVLAPADQGGRQCLDAFSSTRYLSSKSLESWFWEGVHSLSDLYLSGVPGCPAGSWAANKLWLASQQALQQASQTSFEAIVLRYGLRQIDGSIFFSVNERQCLNTLEEDSSKSQLNCVVRTTLVSTCGFIIAHSLTRYLYLFLLSLDRYGITLRNILILGKRMTSV